MFRNFLSIAWRNIKKKTLYSAINIAGLSIGLAAAIVIMLYVHHELSADKHHEHYEHLYRVGVEIGMGGPPIRAAISSYPVGRDLQANFPEVDGYTRFFTYDYIHSEVLLEYGDRGIYEKGLWVVDSSFLELFSYTAIYGDPLAALRINDMAVVTLSTAERIFGPGDPVGKAFRFDGQYNLEVGAVIADPPDNAHLKYRMLLGAYSLDNFMDHLAAGDNYFQNNLFTYVKANQPLNTTEFREKVDDFIYENVLVEMMEHGFDGVYNLRFSPMRDIYFEKDVLYEPSNPEPIPAKGDRMFVFIFITIAIFLTAIASINYMNMAIARSSARSKEVGVRKVLGADKGSLVKQFFTESLLVSFFALLLALLWVELSLPFFNQLLAKNLSFSMLYEAGFIAGILGLVIFTGLLSGSYPALYLSGFRPIDVLKQQLVLSDNKLLVRKILVGLQFTISVFMILATLFVVQQLHYMRNKDMGFRTENIMILNIRDIEVDRRQSLRGELEQLSMVESVSFSANNIPGAGSSLQQWGFNVETEEGFAEYISAIYHADPRFAEVYGFEMLAGRFYDADLPTDLTDAFVINETAARLFGWDDPVGKQLQNLSSANNEMRRVIGVVKDFHTGSFEQGIFPLVIIPVENASYLNLSLMPGAASGAWRAVEEVWNSFTGGLPLRHQFMEERQRLSQQTYVRLGQLFTVFAVLCILLSLMGLFGLSGFSAEQKTKEIGIRVVHGAGLKDILFLLYREYLWLMVVSVVIASAAGFFFIDNWLAQFAFRISVSVPPFFVAGLLCFGVSLLTVSYHAVRATGVGPVEALKYE